MLKKNIMLNSALAYGLILFTTGVNAQQLPYGYAPGPNAEVTGVISLANVDISLAETGSHFDKKEIATSDSPYFTIKFEKDQTKRVAIPIAGGVVCIAVSHSEGTSPAGGAPNPGSYLAVYKFQYNGNGEDGSAKINADKKGEAIKNMVFLGDTRYESVPGYKNAGCSA